MIMEIALILVVGALNIVCFFIGAKVGQTVAKGEDIKTPTVNPMQAIRERNDRKDAERAQERVEIIMQNIENYDGSGNGQKDVPRG